MRIWPADRPVAWKEGIEKPPDNYWLCRVVGSLGVTYVDESGGCATSMAKEQGRLICFECSNRYRPCIGAFNSGSNGFIARFSMSPIRLP